MQDRKDKNKYKHVTKFGTCFQNRNIFLKILSFFLNSETYMAQTQDSSLLYNHVYFFYKMDIQAKFDIASLNNKLDMNITWNQL